MMTRRSCLTRSWLWILGLFASDTSGAKAGNTEREEQLEAQLSLCMMAAEGSQVALGIKGDEYGWSPSLELVRELHEVVSTLQGRIHTLRCCTPEVANCPPGADYDPYFEGMANGKAYALAILDGYGGQELTSEVIRTAQRALDVQRRADIDAATRKRQETSHD